MVLSILNLSKGWIRTVLARIYGGRRPRRWAGQAEPRAGAAPLWGCAARLVQLNPPVKGSQNVIPSP